jgi:DNA topoisomerase I
MYKTPCCHGLRALLQEKLALKEGKEAAEAKYRYALVDGHQEPVGNFRVEPPGLFRGRGEHPKMGKLKCRIYPRDITINIGKGVPIPTHPYPDQEYAACMPRGPPDCSDCMLFPIL